VPAECSIILAQANVDGIASETLRIDVPKEKDGSTGGDNTWQVDTGKPVTWRKRRKLDATSEVFTFLDQAIRQQATLSGVIIVAAKGDRWAELTCDEKTFLQSELVREHATQLRDLIPGANLTLEVAMVHLTDGQRLLDLTNELRESLTRHEVTQI
jgi:hypothetical protein